MDRLPSALIVAVVLAGVLVALAAVWRARLARDARLASAPVPADPGPVVAAADALHLATTRAGAPLERAAVPGLAYRGRTRLAVHPTGVEVAVVGERPVWIPSAALAGTGRATWTLDRAVERDGIAVVAWRPPAAAVDGTSVVVETSVRFDDDVSGSAVLTAIDAIAVGSATDADPDVPHPPADPATGPRDEGVS